MENNIDFDISEVKLLRSFQNNRNKKTFSYSLFSKNTKKHIPGIKDYYVSTKLKKYKIIPRLVIGKRKIVL